MQSSLLRPLTAAGIFAAVLMANPIPMTIPVSQQGTGYYSLSVQPESGFITGPYQCSGQGIYASGTGCTMSQQSTTGSTASGQVLAYSDSSGIHVLADTSTAGYALGTAEASGGFTDTITNNSGVNVFVDLSFHVDGSIVDSFGGSSTLGIEVVNGHNTCLISSYYCSVTPLQEWFYHESGNNSESFNQNFVTVPFTISAGASYTFLLYMDAYSVSSNGGIAQTDAQNTLSVTGFTATDTVGNPILASQFSSANGANYSSIDTSATPEPAAFLLAGSGLLGLGLWRRRRRATSADCDTTPA